MIFTETPACLLSFNREDNHQNEMTAANDFSASHVFLFKGLFNKWYHCQSPQQPESGITISPN